MPREAPLDIPPGPEDHEPVLGGCFFAAFVGLAFLAAVLAWNAFTLPPQGFAP